MTAHAEPGGGAGPNAIGRALGLLGDEWTLLLVRQLQQGPARYGDLRAALGIADAVLAARLRAMTDAGLVAAGYRLTPAGLDLWALLVSIWAWEAAWVDHHAEPLPALRHADCGLLCTAEQSCRSCGALVGADDVTVTTGPGGGAARAVPLGSTRRRSVTAPAGTSRTPPPRTVGAGLFPETMALLGNRWSAAMLGATFLGAGRFTELQDALGAPPATVADRLRSLTAGGVVLAEAEGGPYRLTPKGRATFGIVAHLVTWAEQHLAVPDGPALVATHEGHVFAAALACSVCHGRLTRSSVVVEQPGFAAARTRAGGRDA